MKKKKSNQILLVLLLLVALVFAVVTIITARSTYNKKVAAENITEPDFNAMTEFSKENSDAVLKALKSGSAEKLGNLMIDPKGAENVIGFAGWKQRPEDIVQRNDLRCRPCTCHGTNHCRYGNYACRNIEAETIIQKI